MNLKNIGPDGLAKNRIFDDGKLKKMKTMKNNQKIWKYLGKLWKPTKSRE